MSRVPRAQTAQQVNILVIDDDADLRALLTDILVRQEHQVVAVASAEEALKLLPFWTFQIALIDQDLPGMDGLDLGRYLRRKNPDMKIAMVTAVGDAKLERQSQTLSIDYLPKPFRNSEILKLVDEYLAGAQEREERRQRQADPDFAPPIATYANDLEEAFAMAGVPDRLVTCLADTIKRSLSNLRLSSRYNERDRILALSGLLTARVLSVTLPRRSSGQTLYEEYDACMQQHGRRTEFS